MAAAILGGIMVLSPARAVSGGGIMNKVVVLFIFRDAAGILMRFNLDESIIFTELERSGKYAPGRRALRARLQPCEL
jgi:hypothetical protein